MTSDSGCQEEITVTIDEVGDCSECTLPVIQDTVITLATCGEANGSITIELEDDLQYYTFNWDTPNGNVNNVQNQLLNISHGTYIVTITDTRYAACELIETIMVDNQADSFEIFTIENDMLTSTNCESEIEYCTNIPFSDRLNYGFAVNGIDLSQTTGCQFDSTFVYTYISLPGSGSEGPYTLESWSVNGNEFSGNFNTIIELVDLMNQFDPLGTWVLDTTLLTIEGGYSNNEYGDTVSYTHLTLPTTPYV